MKIAAVSEDGVTISQHFGRLLDQFIAKIAFFYCIVKHILLW